MRPLIDFVHVDDLPWEEREVPGANLPVRAKVISADADTGGLTTLVEMPPGFEREQRGYYDADEELFYLSGMVEAGGAQMTRYSYAFRPAGQLRTGLRSPEGATVLAFFDAAPTFTASEEDGPAYRAERAVDPVNIADIEWERPRAEGFPAGAGRKTLRLDPETGGGFWILAVLPHWSSPFREVHTFAEENYILEGAIETTEGLMSPGAYLHHPPDVWHGPMRSRPGMLTFTRAIGPFGNRYERVADYAWPPER